MFKTSGRNLAASQSFSPDQVQLLKALFRNATQGRDSNILARSDVFSDTYKKVLGMERRCVTIAAERQAMNASPPATSEQHEEPTPCDSIPP
jgi:hypothetical protein